MAGPGKPGRLAKFTDPGLFQEMVDDYFRLTIKENRPQTVAGLAVHLRCSRETLLNYADHDDYGDIISHAKARLMAYAEESLFTLRQPSGAIFNLKANYGYRDHDDRYHNAPVVQVIFNSNEAGLLNRPTPAALPQPVVIEQPVIKTIEEVNG